MTEPTKKTARITTAHTPEGLVEAMYNAQASHIIDLRHRPGYPRKVRRRVIRERLRKQEMIELSVSPLPIAVDTDAAWLEAIEARLGDVVLWHPVEPGAKRHREAVERLCVVLRERGWEIDDLDGGGLDQLASEPTNEPIAEPTNEPIAEPTNEPIDEPIDEPIAEPTLEPFALPTKPKSFGGRGAMRAQVKRRKDKATPPAEETTPPETVKAVKTKATKTPEHDHQKRLQDRVRGLRAMLGLSQELVAIHIGVTKGRYHQAEREGARIGKRRLEVLKRALVWLDEERKRRKAVDAAPEQLDDDAGHTQVHKAGDFYLVSLRLGAPVPELMWPQVKKQAMRTGLGAVIEALCETPDVLVSSGAAIRLAFVQRQVAEEHKASVAVLWPLNVREVR